MTHALSPAEKRDLETYCSLLRKWNRSINLVSASTLPDLWSRHIVDSLQLIPLIPPSVKTILDIGSGGGLPGLVLAIVLRERGASVILVERDRRKSVFLEQVSRELDLSVVVKREDINALPDQGVDLITARAVAPLRDLLDWSAPHLAPHGRCLFLKGRQWQSELDAAKEQWHVSVNAIISQTDPNAAILDIGQLTRA